MKSISKTFGGVILFLGIIGSIFIANFFGKVMDYHSLEFERDWGMTIIPVSYTHLDVYKRQLKYAESSINASQNNQPFQLPGQLLTIRIPVSYTHLIICFTTSYGIAPLSHISWCIPHTVSRLSSSRRRS